MLDYIEENRIALLLVFIIIVLSLTLYSIEKLSTEKTINYLSMMLIEKEGQVTEILIDSDNKTTIKKTDESEEIISNIPRYGAERLALPNLDNIEAKDTLDGRVQKSKMVWELTFMDSFRYVKYLMTKEGYQIDMYASTPQFIEMFLSNSKENKYSRLVIFTDSIMKAETEIKYSLPEVESYIEDLKSNLEDKNNEGAVKNE